MKGRRTATVRAERGSDKERGQAGQKVAAGKSPRGRSGGVLQGLKIIDDANK
jgi:hypothetical protein